MKNIMIALIVMSSSVAYAQELKLNKPLKSNEALVITPQNYHAPMFQMGADACLQGPMTFF